MAIALEGPTVEPEARPTIQCGTAEFVNTKDQQRVGEMGNLKIDRLAVDRAGYIYMVSMVAPAQLVKAVRAMLAPNVTKSDRVRVEFVDLKVRDRDNDYEHNAGFGHSISEGYNCYVHKLDYGLVHAMFVTKSEKFLPEMSDAAIWKALKHEKRSTPVIRDWLPYIVKQLKENKSLHHCHTYRCDCGVLEADDKVLDMIVSRGLLLKEITIPENPFRRQKPAPTTLGLDAPSVTPESTPEFLSLSAPTS
jgi:hypothetical protein